MSEGTGPTCAFWDKLTQHLTYLRLFLPPEKGNANLLGALSTLTALRKLIVEAPLCFPGQTYRDLSGEIITWKLPHLTTMMVTAFENGELVLLCPKLDTPSLCA